MHGHVNLTIIEKKWYEHVGEKEWTIVALKWAEQQYFYISSFFFLLLFPSSFFSLFCIEIPKRLQFFRIFQLLFKIDYMLKIMFTVYLFTAPNCQYLKNTKFQNRFQSLSFDLIYLQIHYFIPCSRQFYSSLRIQ